LQAGWGASARDSATQSFSYLAALKL